MALVIGAFDGLLEAAFFSHSEAAGHRQRHHAGTRRRQRRPLEGGIRALGLHSRADLLPGLRAGWYLRKTLGLAAQGITNQIVVWALLNALIALMLMPFAPKRASRAGIVGPSIVIAILSVLAGYAALWLADIAFKIDFRFWIVALKLMSGKQVLIFLIYLLPFTAFFVVALHVLHQNFSTMAAGRGALYLTNILALTLGFIVLLALQYGTLWLTGKLFNPIPDPGFVPLSTIVAIQFVPLLAICAVVATFTWRRTGSSLPGALICGIFVTWYVVAGTATQALF